MDTLALDCKRDIIVQQYQRMKGDHISDEDIRHDSELLVPPHLRSEDLSCEDIVAAALERADRYGDFFERLTGREVPWLIKDSAILEAEDEATALTKGRLAKQGFAEGSDEYIRRLTTAIYYFDQMPDHQGGCGATSCPSEPAHSIPMVLESMGQSELAALLKARGGLGLSTFPSDAKIEATAEEAIKTKRGLCTERSKVPYHHLQRAGLAPFFARMSTKQFREALAKAIGVTEKPATLPNDFLGGHVVVGVMAGKQAVYLEPNAIAPDFPYHGFAKGITPREMYQIDISNRAQEMLKDGDEVGAERLIAGGLALGDSAAAALLHIAKAEILRKRNRIAEAIGSLDEAVAADPDLVAARIMKCNVLAGAGKIEDAESCLAALPDDEAQKYLDLARVAIRRQEWAKARGYARRAEAMGMDEKITSYLTGATYLAQKDHAQAAEHLRRAVKLAPDNMEAALGLSEALLALGKKNEALKEVQKGIAHGLEHPDLLLRATKLLLEMNRADEARQYSHRYMLSTRNGGKFSYEVYKEWLGLAGRLNTWEDAFGVAAGIWNAGLISPSVALMVLVAGSRANAENTEEARKAFGLLMDTMVYGLANSEELPPETYWEISAAAERIGKADEVLRLCGQFRPFRARLYRLHAAWVAHHESIFSREIAAWQERLDELREMNLKALPLKELEEVARSIAAMPFDLVADKRLRRPMAEFHAILGNARLAGWDREGAKEAYRRAISFGASRRLLENARLEMEDSEE